MAYSKQDASLKVTTALTDDDGVATSDGIDLKHSAKGLPTGDMEVLITAPALAVGELANAATLKYTVYHDTAVAFGSEAVLFSDVIVQTGANGTGAEAATKRFRLPSDCGRYIRVKTASSESKDKSAKSFVFQLMF